METMKQLVKIVPSSTQLKQPTRDINPLVNIVDISYVDEDLGFGVLPYADLQLGKEVSSTLILTNLCLLMYGVRFSPHVKPEVDLDRFNDFPVVFAGDLHAHSNTQRNIVYPGSPMTTSFHRQEVETGYLLIDPKDWSWNWWPFTLPQLIRKL